MDPSKPPILTALCFTGTRLSTHIGCPFLKGQSIAVSHRLLRTDTWPALTETDTIRKLWENPGQPLTPHKRWAPHSLLLNSPDLAKILKHSGFCGCPISYRSWLAEPKEATTNTNVTPCCTVLTHEYLQSTGYASMLPKDTEMGRQPTALQVNKPDTPSSTGCWHLLQGRRGSAKAGGSGNHSQIYGEFGFGEKNERIPHVSHV